VLDRNGDTLGPVSELLVDVSGAYITYLVFSLPSVDGDKLIPVPATSVLLNRDKKTFMVSLEKEIILRDAPTLRGMELPRTVLQGRKEEERRYLFWYNLTPVRPVPQGYTTILPETRPIVYRLGARIVPGTRATLSALRNMSALGPDGQVLGSIYDFIVDPMTTRIQYVLFSAEKTGDITTGEDKLVAVPLSVFTLDYQDMLLTMNVDRSTLMYAPAAGPSEWRSFTTNERQRDVMIYWAMAKNPRPLNAGMRVLPAETARASELTGFEVSNVAGESLGELVDFVVDENGAAPYAVIEFGGTLGIGDEWFFVPLQALTVNTYRNRVILGIDQNTLERMPGFQKGSIPRNGDPGWDAEIREYWHTWTQASFPNGWFRDAPAGNIIGATAILTSEIMDYDVRNPERKNIGEIEDVMLNLQETRVAYNVLSFGGFLEIGQKLFAVPFKTMIVNPYGEEVIFDISREVLEIAPGFDRGDWPNTANPLWHEDVDKYWLNIPPVG